MRINTRNFGEIEILQEDIISFEDGIIGFDSFSRFSIIQIELEDGTYPLYCLQDIDNTDISFIMMDIVSSVLEYRPTINDDLIEDLGDANDESLLVYNIATIGKDLKDTTVNLKAPIVINTESKKGKQVICMQEYPIKYKIFEDISLVTI